MKTKCPRVEAEECAHTQLFVVLPTKLSVVTGVRTSMGKAKNDKEGSLK